MVTMVNVIVWGMGEEDHVRPFNKIKGLMFDNK